MAFDRFLIAPLNTGLQTDLKPWLIMDDGFQQLQNAYVFRGRVRKRFGSQYSGTGWPNSFVQPNYSRLGINIGTTDPSTGDLSVNLKSLISSGLQLGATAIGQQFLVGQQIFTVATIGTPATLLATAGTGTATFNTTTGALVITGASDNTIAWYYTGQPVMGLTQYDNEVIDDEPAIAFDTQFAYLYSAGQWTKFGPAAGSQWHGTDINFFWATNWKGITNNVTVMFVTNYQVANPNGTPTGTDDPIWFYNGSIWGNYTNYNAGTAGTFAYTTLRADGSLLFTSRIILPFKDRLIALNTIEYNGTTGLNQQFVNRCRYTINGSPFATNSVGTTPNIANASYAWLEPNQALSVTVSGNTATAIGQGAGYIDATTDEQIISAEFIKDRLIVYFERSTWELVYTGNQVLPFRFQKINTELGADATFSVVPFDTQVLAIGNVGVHACSGATVSRIDQKIPDEIFNINESASGVARVAGIRDYYVEMVYWAYPNDQATRFPNQVLVYNYRNNSWAMNDDCITCFGYFEQQTDTTWASTTLTWEQFNANWTSGVLSVNFRQVIAGNQQGYVFIVAADTSTNAAVMSVTNMVQSGRTIVLTIINHTLSNQDYISVQNLQGITIADTAGSNPSIFLVTVIDANTIAIGSVNYTLTLAGDYAGGAVVARVSNIEILSKQWNPYIGQGRNFYLARIDFCVDRTQNGQVTVDYYPSGSQLSMLEQGNGGTVGTQANMGNGILETSPYDPLIYPFEQVQERLWHPIYFQTDGQTVQIYLYMSPQQITNPAISSSDFVLEGLVLHCQPTSARLQ